ncbi:MAG: hypothetical protein Q7S92_04760 [Candidatus Diapherotrites archaeon]|nr:hypothetical protein [Candidatus Diapherotrites archaeon]
MLRSRKAIHPSTQRAVQNRLIAGWTDKQVRAEGHSVSTVDRTLKTLTPKERETRTLNMLLRKHGSPLSVDAARKKLLASVDKPVIERAKELGVEPQSLAWYLRYLPEKFRASNQERVIRLLKARRKAGKPISLKALEADSPALYRAARRAFGSYRKAVDAAGYTYETVSRKGTTSANLKNYYSGPQENRRRKESAMRMRETVTRNNLRLVSRVLELRLQGYAKGFIQKRIRQNKSSVQRHLRFLYRNASPELNARLQKITADLEQAHVAKLSNGATISESEAKIIVKQFQVHYKNYLNQLKSQVLDLQMKGKSLEQIAKELNAELFDVTLVRGRFSRKEQLAVLKAANERARQNPRPLIQTVVSPAA